jgi:hypothetical protein
MIIQKNNIKEKIIPLVLFGMVIFCSAAFVGLFMNAVITLPYFFVLIFMLFIGAIFSLSFTALIYKKYEKIIEEYMWIFIIIYLFTWIVFISGIMT